MLQQILLLLLLQEVGVAHGVRGEAVVAKNRVDVVGLGDGLEEGQDVQQLGVVRVVEPGQHRDLDKG